MRVHIKFFAIFREMLGVKSEWKEIADGTTVEQVWKEYAVRHPRTASVRAAYAVNQKIVTPEYVLCDGDEVGFLPPVSGGQVKSIKAKVKRAINRKDAKSTKKKVSSVIASRVAAKQSPSRTTKIASSHRSTPLRSAHDAPRNDKRHASRRRSKNFRGDSRNLRMKNAFITRKPIDLNALYNRVAFPGAGAILLFSGVVRDNALGKAVDHLEYEAYPAMAEQAMRDIIAEIAARWAEVRVALAHRVGKLKIGEASLVIAVAAPHRPEAYAASRYAIERVKAIVPVWKKEFTLDGEHWVEGPVAGELPPAKADTIVRDGEWEK